MEPGRGARRPAGRPRPGSPRTRSRGSVRATAGLRLRTRCSDGRSGLSRALPSHGGTTATFRRRGAPAGGRLRPRHDPRRLPSRDRGDAAGAVGRDRRRDRRRRRGRPPRPDARQRDGGVVRPGPGPGDVGPVPGAVRRPRRPGHVPVAGCVGLRRRGAGGGWTRARRHREVRAERAALPGARRVSRSTPSSAGATGPARPRRSPSTARPSTSATPLPTSSPRARAGAVAVAVTTGPHDADELHDAGADVVVDSLSAFPPWLEGWLGNRTRS